MTPTQQQLRVAARAAIKCLGVAADDDVVVASNRPQRRIAEALADAASSQTDRVEILEYPTASRHGEKPPLEVAHALQRASVVFAPTVHSISHTKARLEASARGARIAGMSSLTDEAFAQSLPVDYALLKRDSERVATALTVARTCRITSKAGTDIHLSIAERSAHADHGHLQHAGAFGNLPAGEAFIAPVETVGDGTIVIDGSLAGYGLLRGELRVRLEAGRVVDAEGEAADWLLATLDAGGDSGRSIAEIGIGVNPRAELTGITIVDEKARGTAHLAFGANSSFGGRNAASVHIDGVLLSPTVDLDGTRLIHEARVSWRWARGTQANPDPSMDSGSR